MDIVEYASCFLLERTGYNINRYTESFGSFVASGNYGFPSYVVHYFNFTNRDVYVLYADGRRLKVPPSHRGKFNSVNGNKILDKYAGCFLIAETPNNCHKIDNTKMIVRNSSGEDVDMHGIDVEVCKHNAKDKDKLSIAVCLQEDALINNVTGIPIPERFLTVGLVDNGYHLQNKIATAFPGKRSTAPTSGIRIHATVAQSYMNKMFIVIGNSKYSLQPKMCDEASNLIHIYETDSSGKEKLTSSVHIDELLEGTVNGISCFRTDKEATDYILSISECFNVNDSLRDEIKCLEEKLAKAKADKVKSDDDTKKAKGEAFRAKNSASEEKTKSSTSVWTRIATIATAVVSAVSAAIAFAIKFF